MDEKTAELKKLCETIYEDIKQFARDHALETTGCNFTYTEEKYWDAKKKILLLTVNPHAEPNEEHCIPDWPWPDKNPFLAKGFNFGIKDRILTVLAEIAKHRTGNPDIVASCEDGELARFVDNNVILASYVPFRTPGQADIKHEMWEFAKNNYWSNILPVWQPELIVAVGRETYKGIKRIYRQMSKKIAKVWPSRVSDHHDADVTPPSSGYYYVCDCRFPPEKPTCLLGIPHPANCGSRKEQGRSTNWGYPNRDLFRNESPIQRFLGNALNRIRF